MDTLPSDIIDLILSKLDDNKSYRNCLLSATLFHTYRLNYENSNMAICSVLVFMLTMPKYRPLRQSNHQV